MEALAAVGLASNILQFVDFARSIVSDAKRFYETTSGAKDEYQEAGEYAQRLQRLAARVATSQAAQSGSLSEEEKELKKLGEQCSQIANELFAATRDITATSHKDWVRSAKKAVKARLSSSQIKSLQTRLDRISQQFTGERLLTQLRHTETALSRIADENRRLSSRRDEDIHHLQEQLQHVMKLLERGERQRDAAISLAGIADTGAQLSAEQFILGRLFFHGMNERHTNVHVEHEKTLSWIFDEDSPVRFAEFLETQSSLYWVSGKPGSGKSTAMKYICQHSETQRHLKQWANGKRLIVAKYFFWNAGKSSLLKSQEGLLQSILYQVFRAAPALIPHAFPDEWAAYLSGNPITSSSSTSSFSIAQLVAAIPLLCAHLSDVDIKICIFIDGLDEYDGRPGDLIRLIKAFKTSADLKACVSSRPWNAFERAYGQDQANKLYMQDLTKSDIRKYVRDTLENDETFQELVESEGEASSTALIYEIVDAAQGVFLWVILVVRSLLEGLTNADTFGNLQRRLQSLPTDLDEYFERLLFSVDDFYSSQAASMCLVTLAAAKPLPLLSYWFMDQESDRYALDLQVQPMQQKLISSRLTTMKTRLNACSKGLLETTHIDPKSKGNRPDPSHDFFVQTVDFLHRTVRDFLRIPQTQNRLLNRLPESFNPGITICRALLAQAKSLPSKKETAIDQESYELLRTDLRRFVADLSIHALALEDERIPVQTEVELMDEFGSVLQAKVKFMVVDTSLLAFTGKAKSFLSWCVTSNLPRYIHEVLEKEQKLSRDELSHLLGMTNFMVRNGIEARKNHWSNQQRQLIRHLLRLGADPNFNNNRREVTPWSVFLDTILAIEKEINKEDKAIFFSILEDYTEYGASLQSITWGSNGRPSDYKRKLKAKMTKEQFDTLLRLADSKGTKDSPARSLGCIPGLRRFLKKIGRHG